MSPTPDPLVFSLPDEDTPATRLTNIEAVGSYAITIEWEDGHHYGIYTWSFLRRAVPLPCMPGKSVRNMKNTPLSSSVRCQFRAKFQRPDYPGLTE